MCHVWVGLCLLHDLVITDVDEQNALVAIKRVPDDGDDGYLVLAFVAAQQPSSPAASDQ
jgi:hypothetical protein